MGLKYTNGSPSLACYCDADFAGDQTSRKSTTGFVIFAFGNPVVWCSKLQATIAQSSAEAEFIALTHAVNEALFLAQLLAESVNIVVFPVPVYEDNEAARQNCLTSTSKSRLKYIERRFLLIRQHVREKKINVLKINTNDQIADILTKPLLVTKFRSLRDRLVTSNYLTQS